MRRIYSLYRSVVVLLPLAALVLACGGESDEAKLQRIAANTCAALENALVFQVSGILAEGQAEAVAEVGSSAGYQDALRSECPTTMLAIATLNAERDAREALPSKMYVTVDVCNNSRASGTVKNNASIAADVFIDVQFLDAGGRVLGDSIDSLNGLGAGETGNWSAPFLDRGSVARCRGGVSSAFEHD